MKIVSRRRYCLPLIIGLAFAESMTRCYAQHEKNPLVVPTPREDSWRAEHEKHKEKARSGNFDIVFLGDSITERWRYPGEGKLVWDTMFAPLNAGEFGISGDGTQSVLWRLQDGELNGLSPKVVVLLIGTNHIQSNKPDQIVEGITAVVRQLRDLLPRSKVLLMGLFPRRHSSDSPMIPTYIRQVNSRIARLDDKGKTVRFFDIGARYLHPDGTLITDTMIDGLHLSPKGYSIWAGAIMKPLTEWVRPKGNPSHVEPSENQGALRQRALRLLRAALHAAPLKNMHAAEALIWDRYPNEARAEFERLLPTAKPPILIGAWRVLAQAAGDPKVRARYVNKVRDAALDTKGPQAEFAIESLGKLGYAGRERPFVELAESGEPVMKILARWVIANSGKAEDEAALAELLDQPDSRNRGIAAYALRFLKRLRPATIAHVQKVYDAEPPDGAGRVFFATTLYVHGTSENRAALKRELFRFAEKGDQEARYQSLLVVGKWAGYSDLPNLERFLSDKDGDIRIAAAHAILSATAAKGAGKGAVK